jgi:isochorismate synthase
MQDVLKHTDTIVQALKICLLKDLHFAGYRLPGKTCADIVIQKDLQAQVLDDLSRRLPLHGFLVAPFSREVNRPYLIRPDIHIQGSASPGQLKELDDLPPNQVDRNTSACPEDTGKADYIRLIGEAIGKINAGEFEKVVLSRVRIVKGSRRQLPEIFSILCDTYPDAFVYLFQVNGQCWIGATPEPFICSKGNELITVSLASTRPYRKEDLDITNWKRKEIQEQDYVTLHIEKLLKQYAVNTYEKNGPYVTRAGNLLHLRTDFSFSLRKVGSRLPLLIDALHPTPAVCGMSTGKAMDFIRNTEKHDRGFYTGYLGPVGMGDMIQFYVNLRCLQVFDNRLALYIGGGITHDSVPEEEWEETEIKAETLLSVLQQIR